MYTAIDIANFFIDLANSDKEGYITNMKVNKLVYFAQGWSLVRYGRRLFEEPIEAWLHGPVIPSVYQAFKQYGKNNIDAVCGEYDPDTFSADDLDLLADVAIAYAKFDASELRRMTHEPQSPWDKVYVKDKNNVITDDSIVADLKSKDIMPKYNLDKVQYVGYRDSEGHLVLPKEWDEC